jgi:iron(III) transport system permease protein
VKQVWNNNQNKFILLFFSIITFGPLLVLFQKSINLGPNDLESWNLIVESSLIDLWINTIILGVGASLCSTLLGVFLAFIIVFTNIPAKKFLNICFILPMAFPLYVMAFVYVGMFEYSGPVLSFFREAFNLDISSWLKFKSAPGVIFTFTITLFPYIYILTRDAFNSVGDKLIMTSRSLHYGPWKTFTKVILKYSRPWILTGTSIVMMESFADFGGVAVFNYDTFTTAIYSAWTGLFSIATAARLSCALILLAFIVFSFEHRLQKGAQFYAMGKTLSSPLFELKNFQNFLLFIPIILVLLFSLIIPISQLIYWTMTSLTSEWDVQYYEVIYNTVKLGIGAAILIASTSLLLAIILKKETSAIAQNLGRLSLLGYAIPGSIIAVAVYLYIAAFKDYGLEHILTTGSLGILILGLLVRFLSVSFRAQSSALKRIHENIELAAKSLGSSSFAVLRKVQLPIIIVPFMTSLLLVFIEVIKEMPMTLMLRPFSYNTLAVKIYELTSEGEWERAALPGLLLLLAGIVGILLIGKAAQGKES